MTTTADKSTDVDEEIARRSAQWEAEDAAVLVRVEELTHHTQLIIADDLDSVADLQEAVRGLAGVVGDLLGLIREQVES